MLVITALLLVPIQILALSQLLCLADLIPNQSINQPESILTDTNPFYHGLCLKGKPQSCGHPVGG